MNFVTLYPLVSNTELVKDVGQIPYSLMKYYGFNSTYVSFYLDKKGKNVQYTQGLKLKKIPMIFNNRLGVFFSEVKYLLFNSRNIDWLNLYHLDRENGYLILIYKFLNPQGHVYLKLDIDFKGCKTYQKNLKWRNTLKFVTSKADLVTSESKSVRNIIQKYTKKNIKILNNGYIEQKIDINQFEKQNIFITAARLGTRQKDTATLLEAFAKSSEKHNWKLELIGSSTHEFNIYMNKFYSRFPQLKDRVILKGEINHKIDLYREYAKAKVFILDSLWEGAPLVLPEALRQGCSFILSDQIPSANEITNNGKYGQIIKAHDIDALSQALLKATKTNVYLKDDIEKRINYAKKYFTWKNISKQLYKYLKEY